MKTLTKLTGSKDLIHNIIVATGLLIVSVLVITFIVLAIKNGIN
jgi:hypothetical protein